jgi:hypothetical protein
MERREWRTVGVDVLLVTIAVVFFALCWGLALVFQRL